MCLGLLHELDTGKSWEFYSSLGPASLPLPHDIPGFPGDKNLQTLRGVAWAKLTPESLIPCSIPGMQSPLSL